MRTTPLSRFGAAASRVLLGAGCAGAVGCAADAGPVAEPPVATGSEQSESPSLAVTRTGGFALAEFEGYANPATGEFRIERVVDLQPLAQVAALYEGNGVRTLGQAAELVGPSQLPRSTAAPWCLGVGAVDGTPGANPPDTFELYTDPASIAAALPEDVLNDGVPASCDVAGSDQSLYSTFGVFCATVRAMNFYSVPWSEVHAQIYSFTERTTGDQAPYAEGRGTSVVTTAGGVVLPQYVELPDPGGEFGLWRYGTLAPDGGNSVSQTWTFRNYSDEYFTFRGRIIGTVAEDCSTPDVSEDCDPLDRGDNACRLYGTGEACTDDLDCESYSCVGGFCEDGCRQGLYGSVCQFECPGGFANPCSGAGACDDGRTGAGTCACDAGFHGSACQYSCSDDAQNGAETGLNCGGPCAPCGVSELAPDNLRIALGYNSLAALRDNGTVVWSPSSQVSSHVPASRTLVAGHGGRFTQVDGKWFNFCALRDGAVPAVECLGVAAQNGGVITIAPNHGLWLPAVPGIIEMRAGEAHACVLGTNGAIVCVGNNTYNQSVTRVAPTTPGRTFVDLDLGAFHTCALLDSGDVECWGQNSFGQATMPNGTYWRSSTGQPFVEIHAGMYHTCARRQDGVVECLNSTWGQGAPNPVDHFPPGPQLATSGGYLNHCVVTPLGDMNCGGVGTGYDHTLPGPFATVSGGMYFSCGVRPNRAISCAPAAQAGAVTDWLPW